MESSRNPLWIVNAGRIAYGPAFDLQREIVAARKAGAVADVLLFCEHPHVITLGRNGDARNLLAGANVLKQLGVDFAETDRGGDITYHGPGQIVGYPILDLMQHKRDVRWYVEQLEEVMIRTAADYGLAARRIPCRHGIWIDAPAKDGLPRGGVARPESLAVQPSLAGPCESTEEIGNEEKLAALGVHLSRWVTSHGFAFNVSTDLRFFDLIIPCGIKDKRATSLERALGRTVSLDEARTRLANHFSRTFGSMAQIATIEQFRKSLAVGQASVL